MRIALLAALLGCRILLAADSPSDVTPLQAWTILDGSLASDSDHRQEALAALSTFGAPNEEAIRRAQDALHDKNVFVRRTAALTLGELHAHSALPALKEALDDDSPEVSFAAAKALTQLGDTSGRDILIEVLAGERKDSPGLMTNAMRTAKHKLKHPGGLLLMGTQDAAGAMFGPASMVIPAIKDTTDLKAKGAPGRAAAVAYIAKYPDPYAVQLLEWALNDDNQFVRLEAARSLGERGNQTSIAKLHPLFADQHTVVRDMAAVAVLRILERGGAPGEIAPGPVDQPKTDRKK